LEAREVLWDRQRLPFRGACNSLTPRRSACFLLSVGTQRRLCSQLQPYRGVTADWVAPVLRVRSKLRTRH
jgi:hypothetical protein